MKNPSTLIVVVSMVLLLGCSKVIYTNEQVMNDFKTKESVIKKFGVPGEKRTIDSTEEWLYQYDRHDSFSDHSIVQHHTVNTVDVANFTIYKRYIIFKMDKNGNVISWQSEGVDLKKTKADPGATVALVVIVIGLTVGYFILAIHSMEFNTYNFLQ